MTDVQQLEKDIAEIKERNRRVEADKAWEQSLARIGTICAITYVTAVALLFLIGVENYFLSALVPVAGFFLSTLSLPFIRRWLIG